MLNLGSLNYFLGHLSSRYYGKHFSTQSKYAEEILERDPHATFQSLVWTPLITESELGPDGDHCSDSTLFVAWQVALSLCILLFTRPDISYVVQEQVYLYMHDPVSLNFACFKAILLRYVRGNLDHGLQLHVSITTQLTAYTDVDWADIFTKGIPSALFLEFRSSLNVQRPPVPTAGEY
ncbi:ribonuclease H-like domain-containing protein [Tanacetum coccineum]